MGSLLNDLLIMAGVEPSPGPVSCNKINLTVRTYNCNGLGENNKFQRVLTKSRSEVNNGGIVLLQETHIKNKVYVFISLFIGICKFLL